MRKTKIFTITLALATVMSLYPIKRANAILNSGTTIGVCIVENGERLEKDDDEDEFTLFESIDTSKTRIGKKYPYEVCAKNSGDMNEFVRVIITKNITCDDNKKISPSLFILEFDDGTNWLTDEKTVTENGVTMYCKKMITPGEETANFIKSYMLDNKAWGLINEETVTEENGYKTMNINYQLDNASISLNITIEAVQASNGADVIENIWGIEAELNDDETEIISIN